MCLREIKGDEEACASLYLKLDQPNQPNQRNKPEKPKRYWYVIQTKANQEENVKK